ncbi:hypothetical protein BGZ58_000692 [Dissophora ornata]|nr:hypothetical protein BGZ58_000692 [Dissophora ornata]
MASTFGGGGNFGGGAQIPSNYYLCQATAPRPIQIAICPQGGCQNNYCLGGGPATVPRGGISSGDGLYCGKTILRELSTASSLSPGYGSTIGLIRSGITRGELRGGGETQGGQGGSGTEYVPDNLYYFVGSLGVNLGPCPGRCVDAGRGESDYCSS